MTLTAAGNLGIGTRSPGGKLEIRSGQEGAEDVALRISDFNNDAASYALKIEDENTQADIFHLRSNAGGDTNGKINMHVSGSVGIGTTEPDRNLSVNGIVKISRPGDEDRWTRENWSKGIELGNGNSIQFLKGGRGDSRGIAGNLGWLYFTRSPADDGSADAIHDMVIDDNGYVGIGTPAPGNHLEVNGLIKGHNVDITSDMRYKTDIETIGSALDKVSRLRGVYFKWQAEQKGWPSAYCLALPMHRSLLALTPKGQQWRSS